MFSNFRRQMTRFAAVGAMSLCLGQSAWAGLFCCGGNVRPYYSPACEPTWGYHQTCWRKFPPLQPCTDWGDHCAACTDGSGVPQNGMYTDGSEPMMAPGMSSGEMYYGPGNGMSMAPQTMQGAPLMVPHPDTQYSPQAGPSGGNMYQPAPSMHSQPMNPQPMQFQPMNSAPPMNMTPQPMPSGPGSLPPLPGTSSTRQFPTPSHQVSLPAGSHQVQELHYSEMVPPATQQQWQQQQQWAQPQQWAQQQPQQQWVQQPGFQNGAPPVMAYPQGSGGFQPENSRVQPRRSVVQGVSYAEPESRSRFGFPTPSSQPKASPFSFLSRLKPGNK